GRSRVAVAGQPACGSRRAGLTLLRPGAGGSMAMAARILGDQVGSASPVFLAFLAVHVAGGLTAVIAGAIAGLSRKGSPRHVAAGRWFYRAITVVFLTAAALTVMRWRQDYHLLIIGTVAFIAATIG